MNLRPGAGGSACMLLILIVSVLIVAAVSVALGRWLQRKGADVERSRRDRPR